MDKHPAGPRRKRALEAAIRVIDLIVYASVFAGGLYALLATPSAITESLAGYRWLIYLWTALLIGGGLVGFIGRLSRYWLVETPATIAAAFGISIYLIMLTPYLYRGLTVAIIFMMALVAMAFMVRRWLELQIFATEPGARWSTRFSQAIHRRTQNVVLRDGA